MALPSRYIYLLSSKANDLTTYRSEFKPEANREKNIYFLLTLKFEPRTLQQMTDALGNSTSPLLLH
jgi:hypothetical protein